MSWGLELTGKKNNDCLITDYDRDLIRVLKSFRRKEVFVFVFVFEKMPFRSWILKGTRKSDMEERGVQAEGAVWTKWKLGKSSTCSRNWKEANVVWDEIKAVCGNQTYLGKAYKISFIQGSLGSHYSVFELVSIVWLTILKLCCVENRLCGGHVT